MRYLKGLRSIAALPLFLATAAVAEQGPAVHLLDIGYGEEFPEIRTVEGVAEAIMGVTPCEPEEGLNPSGIHLTVVPENKEEPVDVLLGPDWYVMNRIQSLEEGQEVKLRLARTDSMEEDEYIGISLFYNHLEIAFRESGFSPIWEREKIKAEEEPQYEDEVDTLPLCEEF